MKKYLLLLHCIVTTQFLSGQNAAYTALVKTADSLYKAKDFKNSSLTYSAAFKANGWVAMPDDSYNAACSWALADNADSAFFQLYRIATKGNYMNYGHIIADQDLKSLYPDGRWKPLLEIIRQNKEKAEVNLNKPLAAMLDTIYTADQGYRMQVDEIEKKHGWNSTEMQAIWKIITEKDSLNLIKVKYLLDNYGWLGPDIVGVQGALTIFLVIQHSELPTQQKYLPMMRAAVKNGKAKWSYLALLEDRVAIGEGKRQIYGSQIGRDPETQKYYVQPLDDPDNVDKRRAEAGLQPLAQYVDRWQIKWDVEQYKKDLPAIEEKEKAGHK